jgi:hypothetical protein
MSPNGQMTSQETIPADKHKHFVGPFVQNVTLGFYR